MNYVELERIKQIENIHLPRWEELPPFEIYIDQLITIVDQIFEGLDFVDENMLTPNMVNNYVKQQMIPKPIKKKYNRVHISHCIAISFLKYVLSISEIKKGIDFQTNLTGLEVGYDLFCERLESSLTDVFSQMDTEAEMYTFAPIQCTKRDLALSVICRSLSYKLMTQMIIKRNDFLTEKTE